MEQLCGCAYLVREGPACGRDGGSIGERERQHVARLLVGGQHLHRAVHAAVRPVALTRAARNKESAGVNA